MKRKLIVSLIIISAVLSLTVPTVLAESFSPPLRRDLIHNTFSGPIGASGDDEGPLSGTSGQFHRETGESGRFGRSGPTGASGIFQFQRLEKEAANFVKKNFKFGARIQGTISVIGSASLTVAGNDGKTYQVNILSTTNLIRDFGGKSSLTEFSVNDKVMVFGTFTDTTDTAINANTVRDTSIQKRWGTFFGNVTVLNTDNFVIQTFERGTQTVYFGTGKFVNRKEAIIAYSDVKVGDRVRVKGVWDKTLNQIKEVTQVKDFSLPAFVKPTSAPSPTPTVASSTPTP